MGGAITQSRIVNRKEENSIIDFILTCDKVLPFSEYMYIDENRKFAMANFSQKKKGQIAKLSDHNLIYADFNFKFKPLIQQRKHIFKFDDPISLQRFKMLTSRTEEFTNCFINNKPFNEQIKSWKRVLKKFLNICF